MNKDIAVSREEELKTGLEMPVIETEGQPYIDRRVMKRVPVLCGKEPMVGKITRYIERTPLRWMKPDGKGGLVPDLDYMNFDPSNR